MDFFIDDRSKIPWGASPPYTRFACLASNFCARLAVLLIAVLKTDSSDFPIRA